ncbi:MAG: TrmH family RNA methyltransferase [Bacteroidia bacterium]
MQPLSKAKLKLFSSLKTRKFRQREGMFMVEGWKMLSEAEQASWEIEAIVVREDVYKANASLPFVVQEEKLFYLEDHPFNKLSSLNSPEGVLAILRTPDMPAWEHTLPNGRGFLLEQIQDPGNLGTLLRIADWFGLEGICCSPGTVELFNPKTLRASMGAVFRVPVYESNDWEQMLQHNKDRIWLADMEGKALGPGIIEQDDWVLLGNEANGVSEFARKLLADRKLTIPRKGKAESLNAAIAGGIFAYWM